MPVTGDWIFYGQNSKISDLPVIGDWILRADPKNQRFARKRGLSFYGQNSKIGVLPVTEGCILRADLKNQC
ncbi:MAG: hypothetical protein ACI31P_01760, partial [Ligilactobacillus ruminis]